MLRVDGEATSPQMDTLVTEEPLEIRLAYGPGGQRQQQALAVTMRTPGQDSDLAAGFLFSEGIIGQKKDILRMRYTANQLEGTAQENVLLVELDPALDFDMNRLNRHFYTSSSCGICGKASIELVQTTTCYLLRDAFPKLTLEQLHAMPHQMREEQSLFECTGGIHAAGLFDSAGQLCWMREDIGRHNAVDKLLGAALQENAIPLQDKVLLLSGRLSFELAQKALMAGIPIVAAVGAPSSLAVELAETYGQTLIGFLRDGRFNIYTGKDRIQI
jgi:FdhD protein